MTNQLNFSAEESDFPSADIDPWQFYTSPSDESGESDLVQARVEPSLARRMDELIQTAKEKGVRIKTRSDFTRLALFRMVNDLAAYLHVNEETLTHWLLLEKQTMRAAHQSAQLMRVRETVVSFQSGFSVLIQNEDWEEAKTRLTGILVNILGLAGDQDFLMRMYIRGFFSYKPFTLALEKLEKNVNSLGSVIINAQRGYQMMIGEGRKED